MPKKEERGSRMPADGKGAAAFGLFGREECKYDRHGIPVYRFANPALHSFCLCLYVRAGSMFETESENGITHFLEHLVFRSVNRQMKGELYRTLDRLGLTFEGVTYREFVRFSVTGSPKHFKTGAEILLRVLSPLSLSAEELRTERSRVKAEIREDGTVLFHSIDGNSGGKVREREYIMDPATGNLLNREGRLYWIVSPDYEGTGQ